MSKNITYLGKTYKTNLDVEDNLTNDEYHEIVENFLKKPDIEQVKEEMRKIHRGGIMIPFIYRFFLKELMIKTRVKTTKWTIYEALQSKEIINFLLYIIKRKPKVFHKPNIWENLETAFRISGKSVCRKPSNFPMKTIDNLLEKYCPQNGNYYDYSCGWGIRLLSSLKNHVNYFGTDTNIDLCNTLNKIKDLYIEVNYKDEKPTVDIRCSGSENFINEWENKMDFCFSSPPYFDYEIYEGEKTSTTLYPNYDKWLNDYVVKTFENCYKYLKDGGVFSYNIHNITDVKYDLEKDFFDIASNVGFKLIGEEILKNPKRYVVIDYSTNEKVVYDNSEKIKIFKKEK